MCHNRKILLLRVLPTHVRVVLDSLHGLSGHVDHVSGDEFSRIEGLLRLKYCGLWLLLFVVDFDFLGLVD